MNSKIKYLIFALLLNFLTSNFSYADVGDATPLGAPTAVSTLSAALKNASDTTLTDITVTWTLLTDSQTAGSPIIGYQAVPYAAPYASAGLTSCTTGPATNS